MSEVKGLSGVSLSLSLSLDDESPYTVVSDWPTGRCLFCRAPLQAPATPGGAAEGGGDLPLPTKCLISCIAMGDRESVRDSSWELLRGRET